MELKIGKRLAEYRLVFFQPEPEDGERLCIGLLFSDEGNRRMLVYDSSFARVRCFAPNFEVGLLRFLMKTLDSQLQDRNLSMDQALASLGSQLSLSVERRVASPVSDAAKMRLLERFVIRKETKLLSSVAASEKVSANTLFAEHLLSFARPLIRNTKPMVIENANAEQVLGRKIPGVGRVSLLIETKNRLTVLDGVDLSIQSPQEAINRTGKVAHTFWQYGRYGAELVIPRKINRVAVIFNGTAHPGPTYRDAQNFAREILAERSEMLIEHDGAEDLSRLESLVLQ
jgi:hypothetical protein